jgi:hypothetical protein
MAGLMRQLGGAGSSAGGARIPGQGEAVRSQHRTCCCTQHACAYRTATDPPVWPSTMFGSGTFRPLCTAGRALTRSSQWRRQG